MKAMAKDFGGTKPPIVHVDASAAIGIAQRKGLGRVRHIDTQTLWVHEAVRNKRITLTKVDGPQHPADLMTKALGKEAMEHMMAKMGLVKAQGRSKVAPLLVKNDKGETQEFSVETEVDAVNEAGPRDKEDDMPKVKEVKLPRIQKALRRGGQCEQLRGANPGVARYSKPHQLPESVGQCCKKHCGC